MTIDAQHPPLFVPGNMVMTPGVGRLGRLLAPDELILEVAVLISRHLKGDWGDVDDEDKAANDAALVNGERLVGSYKIDDTKVWIITEWDRSVLTVLLPDEY